MVFNNVVATYFRVNYFYVHISVRCGKALETQFVSWAAYRSDLQGFYLTVGVYGGITHA